MPFISSMSAGKGGRIFPLGAKPATIGNITLTAGDANDTFSWSAPANNGLAISKYGYQTSTNNGSSWNTEVEVLTTSAVLNTQYSTSSFKIRVRAFNAAGWGEYSTISSSGTGVWALGSVTDSTSCTCSQGCTCSTCDSCGTSTGTQTASGTQSRTCYRWTRAGSTTSSLRNANGVDACSASYGACGSCGSYSACTGCSGCGTWNNVTESYGYNVPFAFAGTEFYTEYVPTFGGYRAFVYDNFAFPYGGGTQCPGWQFGADTAYHLLYVCSVTGAQRVTFVGCGSIA